MDIWFVADTHYAHKNIVRGVTDWATDPDKGASSVNSCRDFDTLEEHNDKLVENINKCVKEGDILYHAGDWSFGGLSKAFEFRKRINCKNIHLRYGNHDHHIINNRDNIQSKFSSTGHYMSKKIKGQEIVMSHYSMRTWDKGHRGTWMLYGHSHGTLPNYGYVEVQKGTTYPLKYLYKTMDIGIDTHPEFRPYNFDEIYDIMKYRVFLKVDHHNEETF